jgi:hypothetical protein
MRDNSARGELNGAVVELYNIVERGRAVANGWYVARYANGTRRSTLRDFGRDERAAREFAKQWNAEHGMRDNPRRPPRLWMRDCVRGVRDSGSARDPGAVCGALWYRKMDAGQRRAALAREGVMDNPLSSGATAAIAVAAALAVGGLVWLATRPKKAAATLTPRAAPSAAPSTSSVTQATAQSAQQLHPSAAFTV